MWWLSLKEEPRVMLYQRPGSGALLGSSLLLDILQVLDVSLDGFEVAELMPCKFRVLVGSCRQKQRTLSIEGSLVFLTQGNGVRYFVGLYN